MAHGKHTLKGILMPQRKPVVHYRPSENDFIKVGHSAYIKPINHWDRLRVSNQKFVLTSEVLEVFKSGIFETKNTIYQPEAKET